jgi:type IV secretion system protein TrbE
MLSLREYREPTHRLPDRLPWACLIAPGVVLQKDAVFQKTAAFRGPDLSSSLDSELVSASARINNALRRLGSGWGLFIEAQWFESSAYPRSKWSHPAAAVVDLERQTAFEQGGAHYESSYYLTFTWRLPPERSTRAAALFFDEGAGRTADESTALSRELRHFQKAVAEIVDILSGVLPEVGALDDDQTLAYLHSTISTHRHPVQAPETPMYLDAVLPDMPFTPGDVPMLGDHFLCTLTISGFPGSTFPGLLDALNHLQTEYRWMTRFLCLDNFNYSIQVIQGHPAWTPLQAFDDGRRTFVRFPPAMLVREAPALFVLRDKETQLVNYRVKGDTYVIDRLVDSAELRVGQQDQEIVRIVRGPDAARPNTHAGAGL